MNSLLRVLFVEDSEDDVLLLVRELRKGGYNPTCDRVETATALLAALDQQTWDVVISDYVLPDFSAPEALQILQASRLDLPFIVVSRVVGEDAAVGMMKAGAHDYLLKGQLKRLVPAVERELREAEIRREKRQAEAALHHTLDQLEKLVEQRTTELVRVNQELQAEIEERTRAEQALLQLAAIVQSSDDAIISMGLDGRVLSWNPGAEKLYGYSTAEAKGQPLARLIQPNSQVAWQDLEENLLVKTVDHRQTIHKRKDGEMIDVFMSVSPIKDTAGRVTRLSLIAADISGRRMIERIKDELISVVSHELRTPIASLQASIELLLTGKLGDLSAQGQRMLEIAAKNIDRLVQLTNNFLDLEGLASGRITLYKQPCNVLDLMTQAGIDTQEIVARAGVHLALRPISAQLAVDPKRIIQVLINLIGNAIKFSQPGDRIWITSELQHTENRSIPVIPPYVLIRIQDEGEGIPTHSLETIFDHFQQVNASDSRRQGGAGLGLAICRRIIRQHQGHLWVESVIGQGSTFYLALPLEPAALEKIELKDLTQLEVKT